MSEDDAAERDLGEWCSKHREWIYSDAPCWGCRKEAEMKAEAYRRGGLAALDEWHKRARIQPAHMTELKAALRRCRNCLVPGKETPAAWFDGTIRQADRGWTNIYGSDMRSSAASGRRKEEAYEQHHLCAEVLESHLWLLAGLGGLC